MRPRRAVQAIGTRAARRATADVRPSTKEVPAPTALACVSSMPSATAVAASASTGHSAATPPSSACTALPAIPRPTAIASTQAIVSPREIRASSVPSVPYPRHTRLANSHHCSVTAMPGAVS